MSRNRMFGDEPKSRLIVSVEDVVIDAIDDLLSRRDLNHPAVGNRSEFVRLAIERELESWLCPEGSKRHRRDHNFDDLVRSIRAGRK